jgi:hypothetical protein
VQRVGSSIAQTLEKIYLPRHTHVHKFFQLASKWVDAKLPDFMVRVVGAFPKEGASDEAVVVEFHPALHLGNVPHS